MFSRICMVIFLVICLAVPASGRERFVVVNRAGDAPQFKVTNKCGIIVSTSTTTAPAPAPQFRVTAVPAVVPQALRQSIFFLTPSRSSGGNCANGSCSYAR